MNPHIRRGALPPLRILVTIAVWTLSFLALGEWVIFSAGVSPAVMQATVWAVWLVWLGWWFPARRARVLRLGLDDPYAHALVRDIVPGITVAFSQILRPAAYVLAESSIDASNPVRLALAALCFIGGLGTIVVAVNRIGVSAAMFVYEYEPPSSTPIVQTGIYRRLRHPMFLGGVLFSCGLGLLAGDPVAMTIAAVNIGALLPYQVIEDSRCRRVYGEPYVRYSHQVGGFLPSPDARHHWRRRIDGHVQRVRRMLERPLRG